MNRAWFIEGNPNCRCSIRKGEFRLSKQRTDKDGNPVPCELCKLANESWNTKGFIEDTFGTRYENNKQEEINLGLLDKEEKIDSKYNIDMEDENSTLDNKKTNVNMVSAILKDGTTINTDGETIDVGSVIYTIDGSTNSPVPAGEYELEDGTIIVVDEMSVVAEIKETAPESPAEDATDTVEEACQPKDDTKMASDPMLGEIKSLIEALSAKIDGLMSGEMQSASATEHSQSLSSKVEQMETKLEKLLVDNEMKNIETTDDVKKISQESHNKRKLDYDLITKYNKKF